jgi:hypothetical protein
LGISPNCSFEEDETDGVINFNIFENQRDKIRSFEEVRKV